MWVEQTLGLEPHYLRIHKDWSQSVEVIVGSSSHRG